MHQTTLSPPADQIVRGQPRPRLALLLALLAIPGSTVAWDLPASGLWIGLPLAAAAIALGLRTRRELGTAPPMVVAAVAIGALAIAQMVVYLLASVAS